MRSFIGRCNAIVYAWSPRQPVQVTGLRYGIAKQRFAKHLKMQLHFSSTTVLENWICLLDGWAYLHLMFKTHSHGIIGHWAANFLLLQHRVWRLKLQLAKIISIQLCSLVCFACALFDLIYLHIAFAARKLRLQKSHMFFTCEVPKPLLIFLHVKRMCLHVKHMCLGQVFHTCNFTGDFSHVKLHMWL